MTNKSELRAKITRYLKEVPPTTVWGACIHAAMQFEGNNFEKLLQEITSQYYDNKEGMINVIGAVPMLLILQYSKISPNASNKEEAMSKLSTLNSEYSQQIKPHQL